MLTYNQRHRKTYDTLCLLKAKGYSNVTVYGQPMTYVKKSYPLISHRPGLVMNIPELDILCKNLEYEYVEGNFTDTIGENDLEAIFLLCGAGILPDVFVKNHKIINSHPGYSPLARGLDAYKWSVYYGLPIGVTTHLLGDYVDAGEILERRMIEISKYDTFHSVSQRVYENEIDMLVGAIELLEKKHEYIVPDNEIFRRMPQKKEKELIALFDQRKGQKQKFTY